MLPRNTENDDRRESLTWEDLTRGLPTIVALARLCSKALLEERRLQDLSELSEEALAILYAARHTGSISIRGDKNAFEPGERFLAICVELEEGRRIEFRCAGNSRQTIRFVDGFRQLCLHGLVMHQLMDEFSLTAQAFDLASEIELESVEELLQFGHTRI